MLSTQYRIRLEAICERIALHEEVSLEDMIWAEKLAKVNRSAATILRQARRRAENPEMVGKNIMDPVQNLKQTLTFGEKHPATEEYLASIEPKDNATTKKPNSFS